MTRRSILAALLLTPFSVLCQTSSVSAPSVDAAHPRRFVCNVGYTPQQCDVQMAALRRVLGKYPAAEQMGPWTWVLVKSQDWKPLKVRLELDPDSPAFSLLKRRQTFVEEALVTPIPGRSAELIRHWGMSIDDLLALAVTHELGHGLCGEKNEHKADAYGRLLRAGGNVNCRSEQLAINHQRK